MDTCATGTWRAMTNAGAPPTDFALRSWTYIGTTGTPDTYLTLGGVGDIDQIFRVVVVDRNTLRWDPITLDESDGRSPNSASRVVWDHTSQRLFAIEDQSWELMVR